MKKLIVLFLILSFALPSYAWGKKNKIPEADLQGKGYAGTLPDLNSKLQNKESLGNND